MTVDDVEQLQALSGRADWTGLEARATELLRNDPDQPSLLLFRATARISSGNYRHAIPDLTAVIAIWPDSAGAFRLRAVSYLKLAVTTEGAHQIRTLNRSRIDIDDCLELQPGDATCLAMKKTIDSILPPAARPASASGDHWDVAQKVAKVAGSLMSGALGF